MTDKEIIAELLEALRHYSEKEYGGYIRTDGSALVFDPKIARDAIEKHGSDHVVDTNKMIDVNHRRSGRTQALENELIQKTILIIKEGLDKHGNINDALKHADSQIYDSRKKPLQSSDNTGQLEKPFTWDDLVKWAAQYGFVDQGGAIKGDQITFTRKGTVISFCEDPETGGVVTGIFLAENRTPSQMRDIIIALIGEGGEK